MNERDQQCLAALRLPRERDTLPALFDARAAAGGDAPFLSFRDRTLSWRQAHACSLDWSRWLAAAGCRPGDRIAVALPNCDAQVLLLLACGRGGFVFAACNPAAGAGEFAAMLGVLQPALIVLSDGHPGGASTAAPTLVLNLDTLELSSSRWQARASAGAIDGQRSQESARTTTPVMTPGSTPAVTPAVTPPRAHTHADDVLGIDAGADDDAGAAVHAPDSPLAIVFTSGTTGVPKGAVHSHRTYVMAAEIATWRMRLSPADRMLVVLPLFHLNALFYSVGGAIASGARLVIAERFQASTFWQTVARHGITQVNLIAAVGNILLKRDRSEFPGNATLRKVSAAPVSADVARKLREAFGIRQVVESYGMSEAPGIAQVDFDDDDHRACLGRPIRHPLSGEPVSEVRIVDDARRPLPAGRVGRIMIRSSTMMRGYFNRPDLADAVDRDGWFLTADLGEADEQGYLYFRGRTAEMIRHRGENVAASDVEATLLQHPAISDAGCIGVESELGEEDILAAVVLRPGAELPPAAFALWCAQRLAPHKRPRWLAVLSELPKTATEKVARHRLRDDPSVRTAAVDLTAAETTAADAAAAELTAAQPAVAESATAKPSPDSGLAPCASNDPLPLAGITVVDLTTRLPGPLATLMLAQAGARVIRIEPRPHGEETRSAQPQLDGLSAHYGWLNRGKTVELLDLKSPPGNARLEELLAQADVLIEQFRPGVMERLGFAPADTLARHPRLVWCSVTGYGRDDPRSLKAAHDLNYQADAGLAGAAPAGPRGVPVLPTVLLGDIAGGTYPAFMNILLALMRRQQTGRGGFVDIAMSRNVEVFNCWSTIDGALTGRWPVPGGGRHTGGSPRYNLYATRDGRLLAVGALEDRFWQQFLDGIGLTLPPELERHDPAAAIECVAAHLREHDAAFWLERLAGRDACCNLVTDPRELLERRKAEARSDPAGPPPVLPDIPLPLSPPLISDP
ncbi:MAG TPA: AMP-binding protein [Burkholderiaceae bacterium]|nr:AMP-binding protein [Burkholderiaceae bacterium]